ncbi:MAG TPA: hypothetical protein VHT72_00330 [Puia sp.]|nr:hypothetical protein [Puia sp.]
MSAYIISAGNISPQHSMDLENFFKWRVETSNDFFNALEPDYSTFVDSKMIRRMSRIVKMGSQLLPPACVMRVWICLLRY